MMSMIRIFGFFIFGMILSFAACKSSQQQDLKLSVYHWQLQAQDSNAQALQQFPIQNLYLHLADIYWNASLQQALPKASLKINAQNEVLKQAIIPVFYMDNAVFAGIEKDSIPSLAARVLQFRNDFFKHFQLKDSLQELQIDCDWLEPQKEKYFAFLKALKQLAPDIKLSSTIRLYPYKYSKRMGVPPVDYGVLMCYNLGKIQNPKTVNSILDEKELSLYLTPKDYPLKLKPALPVFGWMVWFRNENYHQILYWPKDLLDTPLFKNENLNNFTVLKDTLIAGMFLRKGDILRNEYPSFETLNLSLQLLKKKIPAIDEVILYHWNQQLFSQYEPFISSHWTLDQ